MGLTKQDVREVIDVYIKAWETQDANLITTIFTEGGIYHERVLREPMTGRDAIHRYWQEKVVKGQANITCTPCTLYLDGDTAVVEWLAGFDDLVQGVRKHMKEIAVLEFDGHQVSSLREYWSSETVGTPECDEPGAGNGLKRDK